MSDRLLWTLIDHRHRWRRCAAVRSGAWCVGMGDAIDRVDLDSPRRNWCRRRSSPGRSSCPRRISGDPSTRERAGACSSGRRAGSGSMMKAPYRPLWMWRFSEPVAVVEVTAEQGAHRIRSARRRKHVAGPRHAVHPRRMDAVEVDRVRVRLVHGNGCGPGRPRSHARSKKTRGTRPLFRAGTSAPARSRSPCPRRDLGLAAYDHREAARDPAPVPVGQDIVRVEAVARVPPRLA